MKPNNQSVEPHSAALSKHACMQICQQAPSPAHAESGGPPELPAPAPRVVVHKPSPSWFFPLMGFGGPSQVQWEEEQRTLEAARQRQQLPQPQQQHAAWAPPPPQTRNRSRPTPAAARPEPAACHPAQPPPEQLSEHPGAVQPARPPLHQQQLPADPVSCGQPLAPLASEVAKLERLQLGNQQQQRLQQRDAERSLPWYQQGWRQAQPVPPQPEPVPPRPQAPLQQPEQQPRGCAGAGAAHAAVYPGGNPFADEPARVEASRPQVQPPPRRDGSSEAAGPSAARTSRPGGKLPPPPSFLLARRAQQQPSPKQALVQPQKEAVTQPAAAPALGDAVEDVQPRSVGAAAVMGSGSSAGTSSRQGQMLAGRQHAQAPAAASSVGQQQRQELPPSLSQVGTPASGPLPPSAPPPQPTEKGPARHAELPAAQSPAAQQPPAAPAAAATAGGYKPAPPPPPLPPKAATGLGTGAPPPPPPPQPAACDGSAHPPAGVGTLSAIQPAELVAAASKLRRVQGSGSGDRAAGCAQHAARRVSGEDVRAQLMAAIRGGQVKLRKASDRPVPTKAAGGSWPATSAGVRPLGGVDRAEGADPGNQAIQTHQRQQPWAANPTTAAHGSDCHPPCLWASSLPAGAAPGAPSDVMAELLRRVVERRRVTGGDSSDSDSEWER